MSGKIWLDNYPNNIPRQIELSNDTLVGMFDNVIKKYANNIALMCDFEALTYSKVGYYVDNLAQSLIELGVKKGDKVAIILPNLIQYPIALFAVLKVGAVVVNINPLYTANEMEYILNNSESKVAVILDIFASKLNHIYKKHYLKDVIVTSLPDCYPIIKQFMINFVIKYIKFLNTKYTYVAHSFKKFINSDKKFDKNTILIVNEDVAFIQYTGATTGRPKGAILTHKNVVSNVLQITSYCIPQMTESLDKQVIICALPLYHIFSLTSNLFTFFLYGAKIVMVMNPRDRKSLLKILAKTPFTVFNSLDTLYKHLLDSESFYEYKYPEFKYSIAGGMVAHKNVMDKWYKATNVMPSNCYGLTETSPAVTMSLLDNNFDGSVGYPIPLTDVEIRDKSDFSKVLPVNEIGIIFVKGPQVFSGYYHNEEQTRSAFDSNGWFNTSDLGYLNNKGKLFISGRNSELIIVSGLKVYPIEIESVILEIDDVSDVAVIGVPSMNTGEEIVAYVVKKSNNLNVSDISKYCRVKLTNYKIPQQIKFVSAIPKTLIGKVDRKELFRIYNESLKKKEYHE